MIDLEPNEWTATIRAWGRALGATHVMVEGAGERRRLAIGSVARAIRTVHGPDQYDSYTNARTPHKCVVYRRDGRLAAHLSEPAKRVPVGVILPSGKPDYRFEPVGLS